MNNAMDTMSLQKRIDTIKTRLDREQTRPRGFFENYFTAPVTIPVQGATLDYNAVTKPNGFSSYMLFINLIHHFSDNHKDAIPLDLYWNNPIITSEGRKGNGFMMVPELVCSSTPLYKANNNYLYTTNGDVTDEQMWGHPVAGTPFDETMKSKSGQYEFAQFTWSISKGAGDLVITPQDVNFIFSLIFWNGVLPTASPTVGGFGGGGFLTIEVINFVLPNT